MGRSEEDRGPMYRNFTIAMTVIVVLAVVLRFWSRLLGPGEHRATLSRFWWDDWLALAALPVIIVLFALQFAMLGLGLGKHFEFVPKENLLPLLKLVYINYFTYDFALYFTKTSALFFLQRVFATDSGSAWFRWAVYATHGINTCWLIGICFGTVFMCDPIALGWNPTLTGKCGPTTSLWIGSAVPSVIIDVIILVLPMPIIWGLQMTRAKRIGVTIVFILGYCVVVVSLGRLITLFKTGDALNNDITYEAIPISLWVAAEAPITMLSICLPAMLPLGRHLTKTYLSPLASSVSSLWSTRRRGDSYVRSQSGAFPYDETNNDSTYLRERRKKTATESMESTSEASPQPHDRARYILSPNEGHNSYEVNASAPRSSLGDSADRTIRVDRDVRISRGV